ncbi:MAG TPA: hypothetical protein VMF90_11845 [Rhizobiaceae bacterium]|nr:hypothetical protein [Rhizobiaceae bacterium]
MLPFWERAQLDLAKLREYCLSPDHPEGRHKARVFRSALGIGREDSSWLREQILQQVATTEAILVRTDHFGARYNVDLTLRRLQQEVVIRTSWIVAADSEIPRFVTCRVL